MEYSIAYSQTEDHMYTIIKRLDGKFGCIGCLQDGTERWQEDTLAAAIAKMKQFAKAMNGSKIKKSNITFAQEVIIETTTTVIWNSSSS